MNIDKIYDASNQRIIQYEQQKGDFFNLFYDNFIASSIDVSHKFGQTNMVNQVTLLKNFLVHLQAYNDKNAPSKRLTEVAKQHGHDHLDINKELYDCWLTALLRTLKHCDPKYSKKVEQAWIHTLKPGINYMKSQY